MKDMLRIGTVDLGSVPRVVAIVDKIRSLEEIRSLPERGVDLLEMRIDLLDVDCAEALEYLREVRSAVSLPLIGTIRENSRNTGRRLQWFEKVLPLVDAVDVEIDADINEAVIAMAGAAVVIVSEHDYSATPDTDRLRWIVGRSRELGGDIAKIAVTACCEEDVVRLLTFTAECGEPVVAISMGPIGMVSRVVAPVFGSLFTFGFLEHSVAPGQLPVDELAGALARYYPRYAALHPQIRKR